MSFDWNIIYGSPPHFLYLEKYRLNGRIKENSWWHLIYWHSADLCLGAATEARSFCPQKLTSDYWGCLPRPDFYYPLYSKYSDIDINL